MEGWWLPLPQFVALNSFTLGVFPWGGGHPTPLLSQALNLDAHCGVVVVPFIGVFPRLRVVVVPFLFFRSRCAPVHGGVVVVPSLVFLVGVVTLNPLLQSVCGRPPPGGGGP